MLAFKARKKEERKRRHGERTRMIDLLDAEGDSGSLIEMQVSVHIWNFLLAQPKSL
jgi:hypothetical protein